MDTRGIIDAALADLKQEKLDKKLGKQQKGKRKGMTLDEIEAAEGSTVRESKVGMASTKRAKTRKGAEDTELEDRVEDAEEGAEQAEDNGVVLEPFNLKRERQEGHFDEGGHYVESKADDEKDPWLSSNAEVVSQAALRQIRERERQRVLKDEQPEMSGAQAAAFKADIAALLLPGETVSRGMNRLRPQPAHRHGAAGARRPGAKLQDAAVAPSEQSDVAKEAPFEKLKAATDALMDAGEMDVYGLTKEDLERGAALFQPAEAANDSDDLDDMFSDPEKIADTNSAGTAPSLAQPSSAAAEAPSSSGRDNGDKLVQGSASAKATQEAAVDYASWPIKELRRFLQERGQDAIGIVDKVDLVAKVQELAAKGPEGADEADAVPSGYTFDPVSRYFYSPEADMYYDPSSGGFFSSTTQKWYTYSAETGQFVEWQQQPESAA